MVYTVILIIFSFTIGIFIYLKPVAAIEIQKKFYEKINWRMEPISLGKEIRHTRLMGFSVMVIAVGVALILLMKR